MKSWQSDLYIRKKEIYIRQIRCGCSNVLVLGQEAYIETWIFSFLVDVLCFGCSAREDMSFKAAHTGSLRPSFYSVNQFCACYLIEHSFVTLLFLRLICHAEIYLVLDFSADELCLFSGRCRIFVTIKREGFYTYDPRTFSSQLSRPLLVKVSMRRFGDRIVDKISWIHLVSLPLPRPLASKA